jgi:hypothetical protein
MLFFSLDEYKYGKKGRDILGIVIYKQKREERIERVR